MSKRKDEIRRYVIEMHEETWPVLKGLDESNWGRVVYSHDEHPWQVRDVIAHLADAEAGLLGQARRVAAGGEGVPEGFDLERWNRGVARRSKDTPVEDLLAQIQGGHLEVIQYLDDVDEEELDLRGRHSGGQNMSVEGFLRRIAEHRAQHTRDILNSLSD